MSPLRVGTVLRWIGHIDEAFAFLRTVPPAQLGGQDKRAQRLPRVDAGTRH